MQRSPGSSVFNSPAVSAPAPVSLELQLDDEGDEPSNPPAEYPGRSLSAALEEEESASVSVSSQPSEDQSAVGTPLSASVASETPHVPPALRVPASAKKAAPRNLHFLKAAPSSAL